MNCEKNCDVENAYHSTSPGDFIRTTLEKIVISLFIKKNPFLKQFLFHFSDE